MHWLICFFLTFCWCFCLAALVEVCHAVNLFVFTTQERQTEKRCMLAHNLPSFPVPTLGRVATGKNISPRLPSFRETDWAKAHGGHLCWNIGQAIALVNGADPGTAKQTLGWRLKDYFDDIGRELIWTNTICFYWWHMALWQTRQCSQWNWSVGGKAKLWAWLREVAVSL